LPDQGNQQLSAHPSSPVTDLMCDTGAGNGIVQKACFVLAADTPIDQTLMQGSKW